MRKKSIITNGLLLCLLLNPSKGEVSPKADISVAGLKQAQDDPFGQRRASIIALIKSDQIEAAKDSVDKLIADNSQSPDLPRVLCEIAQNYEHLDRFAEAKDVFERVAKQYAKSAEADNARLGVWRMNIYSLIISGQIGTAKAETEKMKADFAGNNPSLPDTLYSIGRRYEWTDRFDEAKKVFEQIAQQYPAAAAAVSARLGASRMNIYTSIISGQMKAAESEINRMIADFNSSPDPFGQFRAGLPDTLYWIARRYEWSDRFDEAKNIFEQIVRQLPESNEVGRARLGASRMNIYSLIIYEQTKAAQAEVNKMIADFNGNPDLPDTLYWIGRRYGWAEKYEEAKQVFQQIIQNWPDNFYANKAKLDFARAEIMSFIIAKDYTRADAAFGKLVADFNSHPDFLDALYWIGRGYEWWDGFEKAKSIYQQIINNYPDSSFAAKAKLDCARADIMSLLAVKKYDDANAAIDKFIGDFSNYPSFLDAILTIAEKYHWNGLEPNINPQLNGKLFHNSQDLLERCVLGRVNDKSNGARAYYLAAMNNYGLGDWQKAVEFARKLLQTDPKFKFADFCQFVQGYCYEKLIANNSVSETEAKPLITSNYTKLLANYPQSKYAPYAAQWLKNNQ